MTEEEYTKLKDRVEFYLHDNRGNYFVFDEHNVLQKQLDLPNFAWKLHKISQNIYALQMNNAVSYYSHLYFIDANQQICSKLIHEGDDMCYGFACCGKCHFVFGSFDWKKESYEPVFVELLAPCVLK